MFQTAFGRNMYYAQRRFPLHFSTPITLRYFRPKLTSFEICLPIKFKITGCSLQKWGTHWLAFLYVLWNPGFSLFFHSHSVERIVRRMVREWHQHEALCCHCLDSNSHHFVLLFFQTIIWFSKQFCELSGTVILLCLWPVACGILVPQPGIELAPPALEA